MARREVTFANEIDEDFQQGDTFQSKIHIRVQQMSGRKRLTLIEGIPTDIDLKKVLKYFKRTFNVGGAIKRDEDTGGYFIQLTGDKRNDCKAYFIEEQIVGKDGVVTHG